MGRNLGLPGEPSMADAGNDSLAPNPVSELASACSPEAGTEVDVDTEGLKSAAP
jgi:hypothetical protein